MHDDTPASQLHRSARRPSLDLFGDDEHEAEQFDELKDRRTGARPTDEIQDFLNDAVRQIVVARQVPADELISPKKDIVVPAIEALRYSANPNALAALIASSMDRRAASTVLPAYVEILKQLSYDELALLRVMPARGQFTPIADIVFVAGHREVSAVHRNVLLPDVAASCAERSNIPQYVDNMLRLNVLRRPHDQMAADSAYQPIMRMDFVRALISQARAPSHGALDRSVIGLTDLGENFRRVCLEY